MDGLTKCKESLQLVIRFSVETKDDLIDSPIPILMFFIPSYNKYYQ